MKIYIVTDNEGLSGVSSSSYISEEKGRPDLIAESRKLLAAEINACVEGCVRGGATEIVVRDGHGGGWHRKPGSIGCRDSPGNIIKGKRMAGQLGTDVRTVQNLKIVKLSVEENLIYVSGAIPGPNGGTVLVKKAKKK